MMKPSSLCMLPASSKCHKVDACNAGSTLQLRLANNKLSGTIPVSLTYLSVCYLDVSHNAMTGSLGYAMNMLTAFELYLDHNACDPSSISWGCLLLHPLPAPRCLLLDAC